MPTWGLTPDQRKLEPWGLPFAVLEPSKVITDPIHGEVHITKLERLLLDSPALQRLRRVRQLATTQLVYPGATHSRFAHSLGALRVAQDLMDRVLSHRDGNDPNLDLFDQWEDEAAEVPYAKRVAEATILARLGALLHDIGHVPFGHSVEDDLGVLVAHDKNAERFERLWPDVIKLVPEPSQDVLRNGDLAQALRPLILSKERAFTDHPIEDWPEAARRYPFVADIVGNTICADLLDYLPRDHAYTGLPMELGHRFLDGFYVTPVGSNQPSQYQQRMVVKLVRQGLERADAVSELFKYLRYRYELSERALVHHAKVASDAMMGKLLEILVEDKTLSLLEQRVPGVVQREGNSESAREALAAAGETELYAQFEGVATRRLEDLLIRHGDDGFLEHILAQLDADELQLHEPTLAFFIPPLPGCFSAKRRRPLRELADGVQNRRLYKLCARSAKSTLSAAKTLYQQYGRPEQRRTLERAAARFVGLDDSWDVILWIPAPSMRLKAADVLIDDGGLIRPLKDYDEKGAKRGQEIYESHERLWAISVFVPEHVDRNPEIIEPLAAWLGDALGGVEWDKWSRKTVNEVVAQKEGGGLNYAQLARLRSQLEQAAASSTDRKAWLAAGPTNYEQLRGMARAYAQAIRAEQA